MASGPSQQHRSYLLRLWRAGNGSLPQWRMSLEDTRTHERHGFNDPASMVAFLEEQIRMQQDQPSNSTKEHLMSTIDVTSGLTPVVQLNPFQVYENFLKAGAQGPGADYHPFVSFQIVWHQDNRELGLSRGELVLKKVAPLPTVGEDLTGVSSSQAPGMPAAWELYETVPVPGGGFAQETKFVPEGTVELWLNIASTFTIKSKKLGLIAHRYSFRKLGDKPATKPGDFAARITTLFAATEESGAASAISMALTAGYWNIPIIK
jgi:hypothetical protein